VSEHQRTAEEVAHLVQAALESDDLAAFSDLLDPNVRWGAPDDPTPSCQNRDQVLSWYRRGRQAGVRAQVTEVLAGADMILVGFKVGEADRWQVLTLSDGRVIDIRAFDDRAEAASRSGLAG
jgi:ketosteroid isomerase-like protein